MDQEPADPSVVTEDAAAVDQERADEKALIAKFQQMVQVPDYLSKWYDRFDEDRKYVNEDCMLLDDQDCVATNYIFRTQQALMAQLYARDPDVSFQERERVDPPAPAPMMPPMGPAAGAPPLGSSAPTPMGGGPPMPPPPGAPPAGPGMGAPPMMPPMAPQPAVPGLREFAKTQTILGKHLFDEAGGKETCMGCLQDAFTCGWAWVKITHQEDYKRDPIGCRRNDDMLDNVARYQYLDALVKAEEITEDTAEWAEYQDAKDVVTAYVQAQLKEQMNAQPAMVPMLDPMGMPVVDPMTGQPMQQPDPSDPRKLQLDALQNGGEIEPTMLPEVYRWIGINIDPIQQEDLRYDWSITRFEDIYNAKWIAHRVYMTKDDIGSKWNLEPEEMKKIKIFDSAGNATDKADWDHVSPSDRNDVEAPDNAGRAAVWELWDKRAGLVYVWVEGVDRFVAKYIPSHTTRRWFPFRCLGFNRVTGRAIPLSDVCLTKHLQEEINRLRTHEAEARQACYPKLLIKKGLMTATEISAYENANPFQVIEVDFPEDIKKWLTESATLKLDPMLYDISKPLMELEQMSGVSRMALGTPTATHATTAAITNEQQNLQGDRRRLVFEAFMGEIFLAIADLAGQVMPEQHVKQIVGEGAVWPLLSREQFMRELKLTVRAGSAGKPDSERRVKTWTEFANIAASLGLPINPIAVLEELLDAMDVQCDLSRFIGPPMPTAGPTTAAPFNAQPGYSSPGNMGGAQPGFAPEAGPGAPPMGERDSAVPSPEQIPNGPQL